MSSKPSNVNQFEDNLKELQACVKILEEGPSNLQASLETYQKGVELAKQCHSALDQAEKTVAQLTEANTPSTNDNKDA